ncbi:uncharacterized protein LOC129315018 [Prosopis cineraria]|uniref:uncharacterized protein LOC129315018 n=1 Tax=Prosopis cineraria TaxID=364024 RepID=UPI00241077F1|nr:uncharacterized protein LOC129315018 [Prosopis cineraria]
MASNHRSVYNGHTEVYLQGVSKSVAFYSDAFGFDVRCAHESNRWGELESEPTTIAFTPMQQRETGDLTGKVQTPGSGRGRQPGEICFVYDDVEAAYKRAIEKGAVGVSEPEKKEWGQKVGYVRDIDGIVVRMRSRAVNQPNKD